MTISPELLNSSFLSGWTTLPYQHLLFLDLLIFFIGLYGIVFNRKNFLVTRLCIELTYLGCSLALISTGVYFFEFTGQLYALTLILLAASEAAIGLGLLIVLYKKEKNINLISFLALAG